MPDANLDNRTLVRRTLVTMGAMVGACVVVVGTLSLVAVTVASHSVPHDTTDEAHSSASPGRAVTPGAKPIAPVAPTTASKGASERR